MAQVVRVYDTYTSHFKAACDKPADYLVEESDDAELRQHKIKLQAAFRKAIKESAVLSIMVSEELVLQMAHLVHYVKEHAEIVRASTRYAEALQGARELATKFSSLTGSQLQDSPTVN